MRNLFSRITGYSAEIRRRRLWMRVVIALACVVVFCTTYALILPAITMETSEFEPDGHVHTDDCYQIIRTEAVTELACPFEPHTHTDECYDGEEKLICAYADFAVHTHNSYCYDAEGNLVCKLPEIKAHTHTEDCYPFTDGGSSETVHIHTEDCYAIETGALLCGQEESAGHFHDETCYQEMDELVCGLEESEEHIHDGNCYMTVSELICPLVEAEGHQHTIDCYEQNRTLVCGFEEGQCEAAAFFPETGAVCGLKEIILHTHEDTCYNKEGELVCGQVEILEHQHTEECLHITEASEERILDCPYASSDSQEEPGDDEEESGDETEAGDEAETSPVYRYEDESVAIEVVLEEDNTVPEGAQLIVQPVTDTTEGYDCELLKEQAEAVVGSPAAQIAFYDISFYTTEGEYIPVTDNAAVTLDFKNGNLTENQEIVVLHYELDNAEPTILENIVMGADDSGSITSVNFPTEGFSVFGIMALAESEPDAVGQEDGTFTLTYNDHVITFKLVDSDGTSIPGDYSQYNIKAEEAKRYVFGSKSNSAVETGDVVENIAPIVSGYIYSGSTGVIGTTDGGASKTWNSEIFSVATDQYNDHLSNNPVSGFKFYTSEPLASGQVLSWGYGNYTVTLKYTALDNKSFAIVNRANGNYAMTASETSVNNVTGLTSRPVSMAQNNGTMLAIGDVTKWTFHKLEDGTYTISASILGFDGQEEVKYLCLCENSYNGSNDGRGSLTLTDETAASHIAVKATGDGRVTLECDASSINSDNYTHHFWCFNDKDSENSKQYLCEAVTAAEDYSGSWVVVNKRKNATTGIAMQNSGVSDAETSNRAGQSVTVREEAEGSGYTVLYDDATVWQFEKQQDGTYHISTTVTASDGTEATKYLVINSQASSAALDEAPQAITILSGTGDYEGMVRLMDQNGLTVSLKSGNAQQGFGAVNGSGVNEWQTLCSPGKSYGIVGTTVNHPSSVVNLFDYWVTEKGDSDVKAADLGAGINQGHTLKFSYDQNNVFGDDEKYNKWTGKGGDVFRGIVDKKLREDGYPGLDVGERESLAYLFDPEAENIYRETHRDVSGLLQVDSQGYYYYNSAENFAEYHENSNRFVLYDTWGVYPGGSSPKGQFFPFNSMDEVMNLTSRNAKINHYLGLTLTTRFVQQHEGHTSANELTDTVFNFAGDDDVWIFIDDVLVADLGGIHDRASVSINFATGDVTVNAGTQHAKTTTLKEQFDQAGADSTWKGNTFENGTYHTLKFFYLERGNTDSNLYLQYNLTEIPLTAIYKVNQYGVSVPGAKFAVYKADKDYGYIRDENGEIKEVYEGVTDINGEMVFKDEQGIPYSLDELKGKFGEYFILKETEAPPNYSMVSEEIHLHIENGLLLCENTYESGVWSSPTLQVAAPGTLKLVNGQSIGYYDIDGDTGSHGTLFAVVLKYFGGEGGLTDEDNWAPLYGSDKEGYTVVNTNAVGFVERAIDAAKRADAYGNTRFVPSANGMMQLEMTNLPGNVGNYYHMLGSNNKGNTEYTIAYYWTEAESLDGATSQNTWRVDAEDSEHEFERVFGATIEVPNIINRLFAQKLNEDGELVNGARFALYQVKENEDESTIYYVATDDRTLIYLEPDTDGDNNGDAIVKSDTGSGTKYTYEVDPTSGVITVSSGHSIKPYRTARTLAASSSLNPSKEDGTATFSGINNGTYYMREISAPEGYLLNSTEVMVLVDKDAVYANAGTEDDGVTVGRGPGYLVATLSKFASDGDIDNTLRWIYEKMRISDPSTTFLAYGSDQEKKWTRWNYLKENNSGSTTENEDEALTIYLKYDPKSDSSLFNYTVNTDRYQGQDIAKTIRRRLYTTVGWSYYELYQDYEHGEQLSGKANYTKLVDSDDKPQEIANLFSHSTYIQVTDKKADGTLEISKFVNNAPQDHSDSYQFKVELKDVRNTELKGSYTYRVYDITDRDNITERVPAKYDNGNEITGTVQSGGIIDLKDCQVAVIEHLPAGTKYTVKEETETADYIVTAIRDQGKDPVGINTGEDKFSGEIVKGNLYWAVTTGEDGVGKIIDTTSTVSYTNTYPSNLTIHKVDSIQKAGLSGAEFVLYKMEDGKKLYYFHEEGSSVDPSWGSVNTEKPLEEYKLTTDDDGLINIYNIEDGTYYLEEVTAPSGYYRLESEITFTVKDGKLQGNFGSTGITISENGFMLTVPNRTGYELPATGGRGTLRYALCGIILMAGSLMCIFYRRRKWGM